MPPDLGISTADAARLSATVAAARSRGYPIHVALIGSAYDLGSVVSLDRKPKQYARFLGTELAFVYHGRLLVVMPNGFGVSRAGKPLPAAQRVVDRLPAPGTGGPQLVQAGIDGVRALAAASGVHVPPPPLASAEQRRDERAAVGARRPVAPRRLLLLGVAGLSRRPAAVGAGDSQPTVVR